MTQEKSSAYRMPSSKAQMETF